MDTSGSGSPFDRAGKSLDAEHRQVQIRLPIRCHNREKLADHRPEFESMTRKSRTYDNAPMLWMAVQNKMIIWGIGIETGQNLNRLWIEVRKTKLHIFLNAFENLG